MSAWTCRSIDGKAARKIVPPRPRIPYWKGLGADSEEKHEPASDVDTVVVDGLKALDPKRPIREADSSRTSGHVRKVPRPDSCSAASPRRRASSDPPWEAPAGQDAFPLLRLCSRGRQQTPADGLLWEFTNHSKVDPVDQIRTEHLGGAHGGHRLPQRADVRSERHDAAQHRGNRPDGG